MPLGEDDIAGMVGGNIFSDLGRFIKSGVTSAYNYLAPRLAPHAEKFVEGALSKYVPKAVEYGNKQLARAFGSGWPGKRRFMGSGAPEFEQDEKEPGKRNKKVGGGYIDDDASMQPHTVKYEEHFAPASARPLPQHRHIDSRF